MNKFYITTPIYYVNDKPHIGHAYTTLAADVIARYQKQKLGDENVFFLTGTDEHGSKVEEAAKNAKKEPQAFADEVAPQFKKAWDALGIDYNHFIRTTDDGHKKGAQEFLTKLKDTGVLYEGDYTGLYCTGCENFITEKELNKDGNCPDHNKKPQTITEKNWFFKLRDYIEKVQKLVENDTLKVEPAARKEEVLGLFKQGMDDFSISRPNVLWGVPVPWDNGQTIYVWVEALLNYWTIHHHYTEGDTKFWPPDVQLVGKDIIKFHCIYWPALLLAYYEDETKLPKKIFAHGFFTINGKKMSKTVGNVIDPHDLIKEYGVDGARYLILSQFPFGADGDIEESKFTEKYNADLANGVGNLVSRVTTLVEKQITDTEGFWKQVVAEFSKTKTDYEKHLESLNLFEALQAVLTTVHETDEYLAQVAPWKLDSEKEQAALVTVLGKSVAHIISVAKGLQPFLPKTAQTILTTINVEEKKISKSAPLFPRK